jgi:F0F1-type ATP synthase assembly protein I
MSDFDDPFEGKNDEETGETPTEKDKYSPELISYAQKVMATRERLKKRREGYVYKEENEGKIAKRSRERSQQHKKFGFRILSFFLAAIIAGFAGYFASRVFESERLPVYAGMLTYILFQGIFIHLFKAQIRPDDTLGDTISRYAKKNHYDD